jgi:cellulose synthase/poly-beta-1,6-N-acetylglucosamine synthase-like glycosyltransferase
MALTEILHILRWILLAAEILFALPILYLCVLSVSAIRSLKKRQASKSTSADTVAHINFAVLIPAHNEEGILAKLLSSLAAVEYPKEQFTVYVIADNCTDKTAELARTFDGVRAYERFNTELRGKGYALNWMFATLEQEQHVHDAYIVLDADSVVEPTFLQAMARELQRGAQALQAHNTVLNTTDSPSTALRWIALTLMNHVRPLGRNGLGGSSTLTGNGMCLSHALLQHHPWQAFGIAEDYQYYLTLVLEDGERVRYVPDAVVRSEMPITFAQMRTQDIRWEGSAETHTTESVALSLLKAGLKQRDFVRLEALAELLVPPLSSIVGCCLIALVGSLLLWSLPNILLSLLLLGGLLLYIGSALYILHPPRAVYMALLYAPGFILWKLKVLLFLRKSKTHTGQWIRTSRISS